MLTAYTVVAILAAAAYIYAGTVDFMRAEWILDNMTKYGVPHSWLFSLGALKMVGALGLLVGISVPLIGVAASAGLILFFVGAIITRHARPLVLASASQGRFSCWPSARWCCDWLRSERPR